MELSVSSDPAYPAYVDGTCLISPSYQRPTCKITGQKKPQQSLLSPVKHSFVALISAFVERKRSVLPFFSHRVETKLLPRRKAMRRLKHKGIVLRRSVPTLSV